VGPRPDALKAAIDQAWRVFDIPAPATTGVCENCCMDPEIEANILKVPARELPLDYVRDWYNGGYDDTIQHDHVAWFLPQVLEFLASGQEVALVGSETVFTRLPEAGYPQRWAKDEVACLQHFAETFLAAQLSGQIKELEEGLDGCLCMFGEGGFDLAPLLAMLDAMEDASLIDLLHRNWVKPYGRDIAGSPFWTDGPARNMVWDWYTSDAMLDRLTRAMLAGSEKAVDLYDLIVAARSDDAP
jgi:hypothetical protein